MGLGLGLGLGLRLGLGVRTSTRMNRIHSSVTGYTDYTDDKSGDGWNKTDSFKYHIRVIILPSSGHYTTVIGSFQPYV